MRSFASIPALILLSLGLLAVGCSSLVGGAAEENRAAPGAEQSLTAREPLLEEADADEAAVGVVYDDATMAREAPMATEAERSAGLPEEATVAQPNGSPEPLEADEFRIREEFPEVLLWAPLVVTDEEGWAELEVPLHDSITGWRIEAEASTRRGLFAQERSHIFVDQEFFLEVETPGRLLVGDTFSIPLSIVNHRQEALPVRLQAEPGAGLRLLGEAERSMDLAARGRMRSDVQVEAWQMGKQELQILATGGELKDGVKLEIPVAPRGLQREDGTGIVVTGHLSRSLTVPSTAIGGTLRVEARVFPTPESYLLEGVEQLARMPSGCFEQTCSGMWGNIVLLELKQRLGEDLAVSEARLHEHLAAGLQKLLSHEVGPGRYASFRSQDRYQPWLSGHFLRVLADTDRVHPVDEALLARVRDAVAEHVSNETYQLTNASRADAGAVLADSHRLGSLAYSTTSLMAAGMPAEELAWTLDFFGDRLKQLEDPYLQAQVAVMFRLAERQRELERLAMALQQRLQGAEAAEVLSQSAATLAGGRGRAGQLEAAGLWLQALAPRNPDGESLMPALARLLRDFVVRAHAPGGGWYSTQAAYQVLRGIAAMPELFRLPEEATLVVQRDGEPVFRESLNPKTQLEPIRVEIEGIESGRQHDLEVFLLEDRSEREVFTGMEIAWSYREPFDDEALLQGPFQPQIHLAQEQVRLGEPVEVQLNIGRRDDGWHSRGVPVMFQVDLPANLELATAELDKLVADGHIARYDLLGPELIIYLDELSTEEPLNVELKGIPRYAGHCRSRPAQAYEYYSPERKSYAAPLELKVVE